MGNKNSSPKSSSKKVEQNSQPDEQTKTKSKKDDNIKQEEKKEEKENTTKLSEIKVRVLQAKGLPTKDASGSSDPYCVVRIGDHQYRTQVRYRDVNPVWNQTFIESGANLFQNVKEITFSVYDKDKLSQDDFIGEFRLTLDQVLSSLQTVPQWYPLLDEKKQKAGEIKIQLQFTEDVSELSVRNFTHVLEFVVKQGRNLRNMDWLGKSDPYVQVEWGTQIWKTRTAKGTSNPEWNNEKLYVFVDQTRHSEYRLRCSLLDADYGKDDHIGTGYIYAKDIFQTGKYDKPVPLTKTVFNLDKKLGNLSSSDLNLNNECGELIIEAVLRDRKTIQDGFYSWLLSQFDSDKDNSLNKEEVKRMFAYLKTDANSISSDDFFVKFDTNADEKLDYNEVISMLNDSQFQDSELAPQLILQYLRQDDQPISSVLMTGFSRSEEADHRKVITLQDRKTGLLVQENIPSYIWLSMRLLYDNKTGRALTHNSKQILAKMSKEKGDEYDKPQSVKEIPSFIELHGLDTTILAQQPNEFKTFNDFFARAIQLKYRPMSNNENDIVSPADCRLMLFSSIYDASIWVKGDRFTIDNLLGPRSEISSKFEEGAFCIARLAPQDYHRFHWPVSGTITKITPIDGALYTVNPIAVNKPLNVYSENKRCVVELTSKQFGNVIMIAVGATMVGSYLLFKEGTTKLEEGMEVARGDVAGEFRFGGSTVLLLFEPKKVKWDDDILTNSTKKITETLVQVRETIGVRA